LSKISITPVGTCRINTPLRRGSARYPIRLELQRIYGFVHTSEEALQQLLYRYGQLDFPVDVLPILFRPGSVQGGIISQDNQSDLTIIEISSTKSLKIGDVALQSNYMIRYFADFFASAPRTRRYWELASRDDSTELKAFLAGNPAFAQQSAVDQALLSSVRVRLQTYDDVVADMTAMVDLVGRDRVLFVTHVNAATPDGGLIASRDKLIRWVKTAAQHLGVECFDPTPLMLEFGQERALEHEGLDLTHFTNAFYDRWFARVQRDHVLVRAVEGDFDADGVGASDVSILAESIAVAMEHDDFLDGTRQLFAALKAHPDSVALQLLHGKVLTRIGDYAGAATLLSRHMGALEMTADIQQSLMRALLEIGDAAGALAIAGQLLADEYENVEIYETAGLASDLLGQKQEAVRYRKLAFRFDPSNHATAIWVLDHYRATGEVGKYDTWLQEVLERLESGNNLSLARGIAEWAIAQREEDVFARALIVLARIDMAMVPSLIDDSARVGMHSAMAAAAGTIAAMPNLTEKTSRALRSRAKNWAETSGSLLTEDRPREAYAFACACLSIMNNPVAHKVRRTVLDDLNVQVRKSASSAETIALCAAAGDMVYDRRAVAVMYGRALLNADRLAEAQIVTRRIYEADPGDVDGRAVYAYVAGMNGDFATALALYGELAREDSGRTERYRLRMNRFLASAGAKGVRYIRDLLAHGQFEQAITTARVMEKYAVAPDKVASEMHRIRSLLRTRLRQLDEESGQDDEAEHLLDLMLSIAPNDVSVIRRAALEAMKRQDFNRAIDLWQRLQLVSPGLQTAINNLHRSQMMAQRKSRQMRPKRLDRSLAA